MDIGIPFQVNYFLGLASRDKDKRYYSEKFEMRKEKFNDISIFTDDNIPLHIGEIEVKSSIKKCITKQQLITASSQILSAYVQSSAHMALKFGIVFTDYKLSDSDIKLMLKINEASIIEKANKYIINKDASSKKIVDKSHFNYFVSSVIFKRIKKDNKRDGENWFSRDYTVDQEMEFIVSIEKEVPSIKRIEIQLIYSTLLSAFHSNINGKVWINRTVIINFFKYRNFLSIESKSSAMNELMKTKHGMSDSERYKVEKFINDELQNKLSEEYKLFSSKFNIEGVDEELKFKHCTVEEYSYFLLWKAGR